MKVRVRSISVWSSKFACGLVIALAALTAAPAKAARDAQTVMPGRNIDLATPPLDDGVFRRPPIGKYLEEGRTREALAEIRRVLESDNPSPEERCDMLRLAAQLEVELGNFRQAIRDAEATLECDLSEVERAQAHYFLGRLYLGIEPPDYRRAIENLEKFIAIADPPDPDAHFYLGQALALRGNLREAIPHAKKAIELSKTPRETYHRLLLFCYSELDDHERLVAHVEHMLTLFPVKDAYLSQLAAGYQALGRDEDAFQVQAMRYELGFLTSELELVAIAELYLAHDNPHRAARILETEMEAGRVERTQRNLEKLGNMWFLAREYQKARENLEAAARMRESDDTGCDWHFMECWFEERDPAEVERELRAALTSGRLKEPCHAHILLGHALYNQDRRAQAVEQFEQAAKSKACAKEAGMWMEYLRQQKEIDRRTRENRGGREQDATGPRH